MTTCSACDKPLTGDDVWQQEGYCDIECAINARLRAAGVPEGDVHFSLRGAEVTPEMLIFSIEAPDELVRKTQHQQMRKMGMEAEEGETPVETWLRHTAERNKLPDERPIHPLLEYSIQNHSEAQVWFWWLLSKGEFWTDFMREPPKL